MNDQVKSIHIFKTVYEREESAEEISGEGGGIKD
jgi:hypothetical protein